MRKQSQGAAVSPFPAEHNVRRADSARNILWTDAPPFTTIIADGESSLWMAENRFKETWLPNMAFQTGCAVKSKLHHFSVK